MKFNASLAAASRGFRGETRQRAQARRFIGAGERHKTINLKSQNKHTVEMPANRDTTSAASVPLSNNRFTRRVGDNVASLISRKSQAPRTKASAECNQRQPSRHCIPSA